jgi:hypothetical protein
MLLPREVGSQDGMARVADAPRLTEDERAALRARHRAALAEVARLSVPDDHGSGERTARLAGLAAWEAETARLRALLDDTGEETP